LSVFLGGKLSLAPLRAEALSFLPMARTAAEKDSIRSGSRLETAANQISVAERYLRPMIVGSLLFRMQSSALKNAESPSTNTLQMPR
jgi:hypothetical protein